MRELTTKRKVTYALAKPLLKLIIGFIWRSCRVTVVGEQNIDLLLQKGEAFIPCYWHQQHLFCAWLLFKKQKQGLKLGFLISPSVDGEVPAQIIESWGASAIRGSSNRTGARAIRDLYQVVAKQGISPVNTSDGPTGPIYKFKPGAVMLAQLTQVPMLPMAYWSNRAWQLGSWDQFIVPKPFSKIAIMIGEPRYVDKVLSAEAQQAIAEEMENHLKTLTDAAKSALV